MPRAETHKSRLGWNKKEDEWGGGLGTAGTIFSSQIWNAEKACISRARRQLPAPLHLSPDAVIRFALPCARKSGSEYSYPVPNS